MARTIDEIRGDLQDKYLKSDVAATLYGLTRDGDNVYDGDTAVTFDTYFSKVAVERLIIYIIAYCANFLERLLDTAVADLTALVERQAPGRCDWYARKLKEFQYDAEHPQILNESGEYDVVDESLRVVKHAVAIDDANNKTLLLKVAGDDGGGRAPLPPAQETSLREYISRIKYAGVSTTLTNEEGDRYDCEVKVYYDPLSDEEPMRSLCDAAIRGYIQNLPFNGEYSNMAMVDALQAVPGVKVVGEVKARYTNASVSDSPIADKIQPNAGYFAPGEITIEMEPYGQDDI